MLAPYSLCCRKNTQNNEDQKINQKKENKTTKQIQDGEGFVEVVILGPSRPTIS